MPSMGFDWFSFLSCAMQRIKVQPSADAGGRTSGGPRGRTCRRLHVAIGCGQCDQNRRDAESRHRVGLLRLLCCHRLHQLCEWTAVQRASPCAALLEAHTIAVNKSRRNADSRHCVGLFCLLPLPETAPILSPIDALLDKDRIAVDTRPTGKRVAKGGDLGSALTA